MRIAIYARVSTEEQLGNTSIPQQLEEGNKFSRTIGSTSVTEYVDTFSGSTITREGWKRLFEDIEKGIIDIVWVKATDRFSRNTKDGLTALSIIRSKNVRFFIGNTEQEIFTPEFEMKITFEFAFAQYERTKILKRTLDGRRSTTNAGGRKIQQTYGYESQFDSKGVRSLKTIDEEARVVEYIFSLYLDESLPFRQIAKRLNDEGYKTKNSGKTIVHKITKKVVTLYPLWTSVQISNILRRPEYAGIVYDWDHTTFLTSKHIPAIIELERWNKVQEHINTFAAGLNRAGKKRISDHELSGLIRCSCCNAQYYWRKGNKDTSKNYYWHKGDTEKQRVCKNLPKYIPAEILQQTIRGLYMAIADDKENLKLLLEEFKKKSESTNAKDIEDKKRLLENISEIENKVNSLLDAVESGTISTDVIKERMSKYQEQILTFKNSIKQIEERHSVEESETKEVLSVFRKDILDEWYTSSGSRRREIYYRMFESISINQGKLIAVMKLGSKITVDLSILKTFSKGEFINLAGPVGDYTITIDKTHIKK